jgi:hypothetical protein
MILDHNERKRRNEKRKEKETHTWDSRRVMWKDEEKILPQVSCW